MSPLFGVGVKIPYLMIIIAIFLFSANVAVVEPTQEQQQQQPLMNSTLDSDNYNEEATAVVVASDLRSDLYSPENVQKIAGKGISQLEIVGDSMLPTLSTGDVIYIAANETFETIQPGKVVVFRTLNDRYQSVFVAHRIQELLLSPTIEEENDNTTLLLASGDADPRPNFNDLVLESNYIGTALEVTKKGTNFAQPIEPAPPKATIITTLNEDEERDIISSDDEDISDLAETITSTIIEEESGSDGNIDTLLSEDEPLQDEPLLITTRPPSPPSGETSPPPA